MSEIDTISVLDDQLLERVGAELQKRGADSWEVYAQYERLTLVTARGAARVDASVSETAGLGLRVLVGGRAGFAYAGSLLAPAIDAACALAIEAAQLMAPDAHVRFAEGRLPEGAPLDVYDQTLLDRPLEQQIELLREVASKGGERAQVDALHLEYSEYEERLLTGGGASYRWRSTPLCFESSMLAGSADDRVMGWSYAAAFSSVDVEALTLEAAEQANALVGGEPVHSGLYDVVLAPVVVSTLLETLGEALSAREALSGRSLLRESVGQPVGSALLDITDDPFDVRGLGASRYDAEGTPRRVNPIVRGGELQTLLYDRSTASRAGVESTGSAERGSYRGQPTPDTSNLRLEPGDKHVEQLLGELGAGLYIVSTSDVDVDQASGELSAGASGFVVRRGQPAEPVEGIVLGGSLRGMLDGIAAVGSDLRYFGSYAAPSLLVEGVNVAGE